MIDLFKAMQPPTPKYPKLKAIIAIGLNARMQIMEFTNLPVANPGIHECYQDEYFWNDLDFTDPIGLYIAELDVVDTSVNTPDGIEYDCEPSITMIRKFDFNDNRWKHYEPKEEDDNSR